MPIAGLIPILATPFDRSGALDRASLARLVEFQLSSGVAGVAVFGMASEGFALTAAERADILQVVANVMAGRGEVVAGINATSTATAIEQARAAADGGATHLMVLPPYLVKPNPAQLVDFYADVAAAVGLPIMVQDAPNATGVTMGVGLIAELARLPGVASVKVEAQPTAPKIGEVVAKVPPGFSVLGGQNAFFVLEEFDRGAVGTMPACEFSDVLATVLAQCSAGETTSPRREFDLLLPLIRFGMQGPLAWAVHKEVLVRRSIIDHATVRSPAADLDQISRRHLDSLLTDLRLREYPW